MFSRQRSRPDSPHYGFFRSIFYGRIYLLTSTTVVGSGPSLCLKRHNLQSSWWFKIRFFLLLHVLIKLKIMRDPSLYWRTISTNRDITETTKPLLGYDTTFQYSNGCNVMSYQLIKLNLTYKSKY